MEPKRQIIAFGGAYARFMGFRNFPPDDRRPVQFMDTDELAYVAMRACEVHGFWHTLFGLPTNLIGGTARFNERQRTLFFHHYIPWAVKAGFRSTDLMCKYYEHHYHEDLEDVRRKWGIVPNRTAPK